MATTNYTLKASESVPPGLHSHTWEHTTQVLQGSAMVRIAGEPPFVITEGDPPTTLPANVAHEIIALETPTVVENVGPGGWPAGKDGGVLEGGPAYEAG